MMTIVGHLYDKVVTVAHKRTNMDTPRRQTGDDLFAQAVHVTCNRRRLKAALE